MQCRAHRLERHEALKLLDAVKPDNAQNEYYLTDVVEIAAARSLAARILVADETEVMGVNDRVQLAAAEAALQERLRRRAMKEGATLIAPDTVFLSSDARIGRDVLIEPHVVIGPGVTIEDGATIRAFSHLEGARVASGASVGPFARLRPGADIGAKAKVGNFVEVKQASIEEGAKVNHLSYIGDARVGANANIGAGTITCNYDGFSKHQTDIGAGAFIGSNSALVAPVTIGDGRLCRLWLGHHQAGRVRRARGGARPAGNQGRLGEGVPRQAQEAMTQFMYLSKPTPNLPKTSKAQPNPAKKIEEKRLGFPWILFSEFEPFQWVALTPKAFFLSLPRSYGKREKRAATRRP